MTTRPEITLTHLDEAGAAYMVDVTAKTPTVREARATAFVACSEAIVDALRGGSVPKGDVLAVARVAGIAATKKVPELLPLAHVIGVHGARVDLEIVDGGVRIETTVRTADRTGVEMEALTAATVAGLAIVDMVKGVDRGVELREAKVVAKSGGRSGDWVRGDRGDRGDAIDTVDDYRADHGRPDGQPGVGHAAAHLFTGGDCARIHSLGNPVYHHRGGRIMVPVPPTLRVRGRVHRPGHQRPNMAGVFATCAVYHCWPERPVVGDPAMHRIHHSKLGGHQHPGGGTVSAHMVSVLR